MIEVRQTDVFRECLRNLRDDKAIARIILLMRRLEQGNPGDAKSVGAGVVEMRIDYGPGYRVYYVQRGPIIIVLLCGGDKRTQARDVRRAKALAEELRK